MKSMIERIAEVILYPNVSVIQLTAKSIYDPMRIVGKGKIRGLSSYSVLVHSVDGTRIENPILAVSNSTEELTFEKEIEVYQNNNSNYPYFLLQLAD